MMLKHKVLFFFKFVFLVSILVAQDGGGQDVAFDAEGWKLQNHVVPPSPEAASLGSYGNLPINYSTGGVNLSIPLGGVGGSQLSVPMSLNYDASSVKLATMPSSVGLGWSLNAGGVITRAVQGMPDTYNYFTWRSSSFYSQYDIYFDDDGDECQNEIIKRKFIRHINIGDIDIQPDVFYYSFPEGSGSFIFDYRNRKIIRRDEDDLIILPEFTGNYDIRGFTIKTLSGVEYRFGYDDQGVESTTVRSPYYDNPSGNPDVNDVPNEPEKWHDYNSSWYLVSITSADEAERIELDYQNVPGGEGSYRVPINPYNAESVTLRRQGISYPPIYSGSPTGYDPQTFAGQIPSIHNRSFIEQIRFYLAGELIQSADFTLEGIEEDIESPRSSGVKVTDVLFKSRWLNASNSLVKTTGYQLSYNISNHNRLVLSAVNEVGYEDDVISTTKPPYVCTYGSGPLPSPTANAIDFWGYYNGHNNAGLIPDYYLNGYLAYDGANRKARLQENGILKVITYPTGGSTSFEYELNDVGNVPTEGDYPLNYGEKVGGLRIKSITDDPGVGPTTTRHLLYRKEDGGSSGILRDRPDYAKITSYWNFQNAEGCFHPCPPNIYLNDDVEGTDQITIFAYNASPFGSIQGAHAGYSRVEEIIEGGEIGKNVYHYYTGGNQFWSTSSGKMRKKEVFSSVGNIVRDEIYRYKSEVLDRYYIYKVDSDRDQDNRELLCMKVEPYEEGVDYLTACETPDIDFDFEWRVTSVAGSSIIYEGECNATHRFTRKMSFTSAKTANTRLFVIDTIIATDYFPSGNVQKVTANEYEHNRYETLLTASEHNNSDGIYRTEIEYTERLGVGIRAIPEKISKKRGGGIYGGTRRVYNDLGHVTEIYELTEDGNEVARAAISDYNAAARPGTYQYMNFPTENFIWENGLLTRRTYGDWEWNYNYDERRQLIYQQDIDRQEIDYEYDGLGRLINTTQRDGNVVTDLIYNIGGENSIEKLVTYSDAPNQISISYFDGLGRPIQTKLNNVVKQEQIYDQYGRVSRQTYLPGSFTEMRYDDTPLGRRLEETYPDGNSVSYEYDAAGNQYVQTRINERDYPTITKTDLLGRQTSVEDALGNPTTYRYDGRGNILNIGGPAGSYTYSYDSRFRLQTKIVPGSAPNYYYYDNANDLLCSTVDGNGNRMSMMYDQYGRETEVHHDEIDDDGKSLACDVTGDMVLKYQYDGDGLDIEDPEIYVGKLSYMEAAVLGASGLSRTRYGIDDFGRVTSESVSATIDGQELSAGQSYEFNHADWAEKVTGPGYEHDYIHDEFGRVIQEIASYGLSTQMRYNDQDQLLYKIFNGGLAREDYEYNVRGWLTNINVLRPEVIAAEDLGPVGSPVCPYPLGEDETYVTTQVVTPVEFFELLCNGNDVVVPDVEECPPPEPICLEEFADYELDIFFISDFVKLFARLYEVESSYSSGSYSFSGIPGLNLAGAPYCLVNSVEDHINEYFGICTDGTMNIASVIEEDIITWFNNSPYSYESVEVTYIRGSLSINIVGTNFTFTNANISGYIYGVPKGKKDHVYNEHVLSYPFRRYNVRKLPCDENTFSPTGKEPEKDPGQTYDFTGSTMPPVDPAGFEFPTYLNEVILPDNRQLWLFDFELRELAGAYTIEERFPIVSDRQLFEVVTADGSVYVVNFAGLLNYRNNSAAIREINVIAMGPNPGDECPPPVTGCNEITQANQQTSLNAICAETIRQIEGGFIRFPVEVAIVQLCNGEITYVLNDLVDQITGDHQILNTFELDEEGITVQVATAEPLFAMEFEHQPNGNIEQLKWKVRNRPTAIYDYGYDPIDRVGSAVYWEEYFLEETQYFPDGQSYVIQTLQEDRNDRYNASFTYDGGGNIQTIQRNGVGYACGPEGQIDKLELTYGGLGGQQLINVIDEAPDIQLRKSGFRPKPSANHAGSEYEYDDNGNMTRDPHKLLTIEYNFLNLPQTVRKGGLGEVLEVIYDATGRKWKKTSTVQLLDEYGDPTDETYTETRTYHDGLEKFGEGTTANQRHSINASSNGRAAYQYDESGQSTGRRVEYYHSDHLGNVRLAFSDLDGDGSITAGDILDPANEIVQERHYYPFGLTHTGPWYATVVPDNAYRYNGKELDEATGWYDYGARYYDPAVARWGQVDPLAEEMPDWTPYRYAFNNPISFIDPDGLFESEAAAKAYAKENGIKTGGFFGFLRANKIAENSDGTFSINNSREHSSTTALTDDEGNDLGVLTGALIKPNDNINVGDNETLFYTEGITMRGEEPNMGLRPAIIPGLGPVPTAGRGVVTMGRRFSKKAAREKARKKREEQPAPEDYAKWKGRELEKARGKDARRRAHDKKELRRENGRRVDRTKEEINRDYDH